MQVNSKQQSFIESKGDDMETESNKENMGFFKLNKLFWSY